MRIPLLIASTLLSNAAHAAPLVTQAPTLSEAGAARALHEAESRAVSADAPSAIAIVDGAGMLLAFVRMDGVRPGSIDLAIGKARSAALMRRPTVELEENVAKGRTALATSGLTALRGGAPIVMDGVCVGAVGVAGTDKDKDAALAFQVADAMAHAS
ncbi:MAG: heme-binding protein [Sphingomonadales bacterium]|nr:heme-binding protein [Sphingomonadales bacterium]MDE2168510.1 heme-binding protein [Sphingomonadales bacterium]